MSQSHNHITIQLNGAAHSMASGSIAELIDALGLAGQRIAVEVNEVIVPRSQHANIALNEADCVEIIHAVGGG